MSSTDKGSIDYKSELMRKSIHLFSLSIPIIYYFVTRELALMVLVPLTLFSLVLDVTRYYSDAVAKQIYRFFGFMLREHEMDKSKKNLSGATYVFLSAVVVVFFFPKVFVLSSFSILIVSDTAAALIGRKFGKHKFLSKSLEGTLTFFITACIVIAVTPKIAGLAMEYYIGFFAAAVGAIAENISYGWADDNFTIPISVGGVMWLAYIYLLPQLNVYSLI